MESDLSLALPKLCLEHITAEIQHMANVREREIDGEREKAKRAKEKQSRFNIWFQCQLNTPTLRRSP